MKSPIAPLSKEEVMAAVDKDGRIVYVAKMTLEDLVDSAHNEEYSYGIDALESVICGDMLPYGSWLTDVKISLLGMDDSKQLILQVDANAKELIEELEGEVD